MTKCVKKIQDGVIHRVATCDNCEFYEAYGSSEDDPRIIMDLAQKHTRETGHITSVETGIITQYSIAPRKKHSPFGLS